MNDRDLLKLLTEAAERFVNKAPNQKRLEAERAALLDAILQAQLSLSLPTKGSGKTAASSASGRSEPPPRRSRRPSEKR